MIDIESRGRNMRPDTLPPNMPLQLTALRAAAECRVVPVDYTLTPSCQSSWEMHQ